MRRARRGLWGNPTAARQQSEEESKNPPPGAVNAECVFLVSARTGYRPISSKTGRPDGNGWRVEIIVSAGRGARGKRRRGKIARRFACWARSPPPSLAAPTAPPEPPPNGRAGKRATDECPAAGGGRNPGRTPPRSPPPGGGNVRGGAGSVRSSAQILQIRGAGGAQKGNRRGCPPRTFPSP